jgi:hypothetical protein
MNTHNDFRKFYFVGILALFFFFETDVSARPPEESEFMAAGILGEDISAWFQDIEPRPKSLGLFSIRANYPLDQDYSSIVEAEIYKGLTKRGITNVMSCAECRVPQITVMEDRLVITKGVPDNETLKKISLKYPVESFMSIDIFRSKLSVIAQVVLYSSPSGEVIKAERFSVSALNFTEDAVQVQLTFGLGKIVGVGSDPTTMQMSGNLSLLEEIGFGKGGLTLGYMSGGPTTVITLDPTLSLRGRFGSSSLIYAVNLGLGYGFAGSARGITTNLSYDIYLGSLWLAGLEGLYMYSLTPTNPSPFGGYFGLHVGIAIGR